MSPSSRPPLDTGTAGGRAHHTARDGSFGTVLVADHDQQFITSLEDTFTAAGIILRAATNHGDLHRAFTALAPDVVIIHSALGMQTIGALREAEPYAAHVPILVRVASSEDAVTALRGGADDVILETAAVAELLARVQVRMTRPPVPAHLRGTDTRTGLLSQHALIEEASRELQRSVRTRRPGAFAVLSLQEMPRLRRNFGPAVASRLASEVHRVLEEGGPQLARVGVDHEGQLLILLPESTAGEAAQWLGRLGERIASTRLPVLGDSLRVTPVMGWVTFDDAQDEPTHLYAYAKEAAAAASAHLDLLPVRWHQGLRPSGPRHMGISRGTALRERLRLPFQFVLTLILGVVLPFTAYVVLDALGLNVAMAVYWIVLAALVVTAMSIWIEGFNALDPKRPPETPGSAYPPATAIVAAYLPNEAATIMDTVESFQRMDYPADLQVIIAYNTPRHLPVEDDLRRVAAADPRILPLRVEGSTSKAQNVNAALSHVTGEFVGMFDADHHPEPGSFRRAWRWLSNGFDVVQGHCVIRNGAASWVSRTVAVEFESIYAVSHPGRARLHGFGLFGGSNGYWRSDLLARTRMQGGMLTEDIDSTLRVLNSGARIASDPALISWELAPTDIPSLWKQRMRWAQGWFQVSRKHLWGSITSSNLRPRQKMGMLFLLGWREIYPWLSLQILPLIAFLAFRAGGLTHLTWLSPALVLATVFTTAVGPGQTLFAHRLAVPEIRRHGRWFVAYMFVSSLFYTEMKNVIGRIAQIKEMMGESVWVVTPREDPFTTTPAIPSVPGPERTPAGKQPDRIIDLRDDQPATNPTEGSRP